MNQSTVDPEEVAKFSALAEKWWDPDGEFRPLHRINPTRLGYIRDRVAERFDRDPAGERPFEGLGVLDIGCGGGLVAEPLCRLGAAVTGIDVSPENVAAAEAHAMSSGLAIDYEAVTAEALASEGRQFDVVLALEVVEHVASPPHFVAAAANLVKPDGLIVLSTLNRTMKAFALGIVAAEYVLRWLPRGTHQWRRFLRPAELARLLRGNGFVVSDVTGLVNEPLTNTWRLSKRDLDINYFMTARR